MASHSTGHNPHKDDGRGNMSMYRVPKTPDQEFIAKIDKTLDNLRVKIAGDGGAVPGMIEDALLANGGRLAKDFSYWHIVNKDKHPNDVATMREDFIKDAIKYFKNTPLFARYVSGTPSSTDPADTLVCPASTDPSGVEKVNEQRKAKVVEEAVKGAVERVLGKLKLDAHEARFDFLKNPVGPNGLVDVDRILREARPNREHRALATEMGLDGKVSLSSPRNTLIASFWGSHLCGAAALFMLPAPTNIAVTAGLAVTNLAIQFFKGNTLENKTANLLEKVTALAKDAPNMETALFWTAHLYKIVRDANPVLLRKDRSDFWNSEAGSSVKAALGHFQEACTYAGERMAQDCLEKPFEFSVRDGLFDGHLRRAEPEMAKLANRWRSPSNAFLGVSTWTGVLSTMAWAATLL
jgi:hypothetical protein